MKHKKQYLLAIDTSCDDTSCAVTLGTEIHSNIVASQVELHKPYGGVFPTVAKLAHAENIEKTARLALKRAHITPADLSGCAVTVGPGLAPALEVGIRFARQFAGEHDLPLIAVNHMEGHLLSVLAKPLSTKLLNRPIAPVVFPVLAVIISGGHSEFVKVIGYGKYQIIGKTLDDAAGECLDKVGRMLNLGYPAGPVIEQFAKQGNADAYPFPLPLTQTKTYDLSFSGLKTYTRNLLEQMTKDGLLEKQVIYDLCASIQKAVFRHICYKLNTILKNEKYTEVWLSGGVAANAQLRKEIRRIVQKNNSVVKVRVPYSRRLCGDNAGMIGVAAGLNQQLEWHTQPAAAFPDRQPKMNLTSE
ncbi:tRNA (adenosine(37)-N6)-threonylcarbamoyltransferase complex transferase subunit TsaD [Candidatus Woesebacteria bacterium]|nr:tRNA (adenosine(37)-N6)-threonylcarbamoyltransferase complex transferase subunit TsaD [Candidatus Woesebacteria bacterium]